MSLRYLPEHVEPVLLALDLAQREAHHLRYSQTTLFAHPIDLAWVQALADQPALAEKVEAFASRFGRFQDHLGERLLPRIAALMGTKNKTLLDTLDAAERLGWVDSADAFIAARRLRNALVHEYMHDAQTFLDNLWAAHAACEMLFAILDQVQAEIARLGLVAT